MAYINFVIPQTKADLLNETSDSYYVRNIVGIKEIRPKLQVARQCLKDEGPEFILDNFDTYYSVYYHIDTWPMNVIMKAYEDLHTASQNLNNVVGYLLDDKDSLNDELKLKLQNVFKMLLYVYVNIVVSIEQKLESKRSSSLQQVGKGKKRVPQEPDEIGCNKRDVILSLSNILQREINIFWDPPVVEETFVTMVSEICYRFLELPIIKVETDLRVEVFNVLGIFVKGYNHGMTFILRLVQLIKIHEHLVSCIPEGIKILVQNYNCKSLVRDFVREITEWQTDDAANDLQGTKNCSAVLTGMASLMPNLMIPEVMYLSEYLAHESYTLRNSVLAVMCEVILTVLTKPELTDEERESRDDFLAIVEEHTADISAHVRCKVFQQLARLQKENAIPLKMQGDVLGKAVMHLRDKAALVRKCAANCVTTFLSHNVYGAKLQLGEMEVELARETEVLDRLKADIGFNQIEMLKNIEDQWSARVEDIKAVVLEKLKDNSNTEAEETKMQEEESPQLVRAYILDGKYPEAFEVCKNACALLPEWQQMQSGINMEQGTNIFLKLMHSIFVDVSADVSSSEQKRAPTENDIKQLEVLQNTVEFLNNAVTFLKLIDNAIKPMVDLLESVSIGDAQEAVAFFIAAYQFNIDNSHTGIIEMLKIMQRNEQERKDLIINAFKTIYLMTDSTNLDDHTSIIVNRLIKLLQTVPYENMQDLHSLIAQWVLKNIIDNGVINMLWRYFLKKVEISDDDSRAALYLLAMAATGRKSIIVKNIPLVVSVGFGERGKNDILLATAACQILHIAGSEKQDITDKNPPFRIKYTEPMWKDLVDILVDTFHSKNGYYNQFMNSALDCIYRLCSKPELIIEQLVESIVNPIVSKMEKESSSRIESYIIAQCANICGEIAMKELNFLDSCLYKELKRREHQLAERNVKKNEQKAQKRKSFKNASSASKHASNRDESSSGMFDDSNATKENEDGALEGASAQDNDAEFILNVIENHLVIDENGLAQLTYIFVMVCKNPELYDDLHLQGVCIIALMKYMTISEQFCKKYLQLVFTILERSKYPDIKCNILVHLSDLLERFPNSIEPWTPRIYERLKDSNIKVRTTTFYILSNLILRDMIRVQGHISQMAACIVDNDENIKDMSKNFFVQLSHKASNLYNILPDVFSHLCDALNLGEENLRLIMKFLFGLIDKNKQMENLVERFCSKFNLTEDPYKCRNVAFCLSLIQYNEKGLKRLLESFGYYKNALQMDDVYVVFKQILTTCGKSVKNEIKTVAKEIEEKIHSALEVNEEGQPPALLNKSHANSTPCKQKVFKKPRGKAPKSRTKKKVESDSDSDEEKETPTRPRRAAGNRRNVSVIDNSDSD